ncbi:NADH-quinone oxidoreductase subunit C [Streptomyces tauricus]|uniref:NADH-quinone oxidoreductase subunit C n=1 Tax=Streptomyces tauricus TaxID=68274 RepID=UPI0033AFFC8E
MTGTTGTGWFPAPVEELFGPDATAEESYEVLTVDVPPESWLASLRSARDALGCTYFDWLSAVDEPGTEPGAGFRVSAHVVALAPVRRLLVRTTVPHSAPVLPSAVEVYAGAAWHERETHEMFGVTFEGHPGLDPLLLPEGFEGHPLRKDFVLAARVAKAWPGAKEPGESEHGGPKRRQMLPPGVPDPNEWGPLKGQLPPAPARPARGAGRAAGARGTAGAPAATGDRPARRTRTAAGGSASQTPPPPPSSTASPESPPPTEPRTPAEPTAPAEPKPPAEPKAPEASRGSDAPWHQARPAFEEPEQPASAQPGEPESGSGSEPEPRTEPEPRSEPELRPKPEPEPELRSEPEPEPKSEATPAPEEPSPDADAQKAPNAPTGPDKPESPTGGAQ